MLRFLLNKCQSHGLSGLLETMSQVATPGFALNPSHSHGLSGLLETISQVATLGFVLK